MPGTAPLYIFQHLLDDLKLLNIISKKTRGMLNFSPPMKSICLQQMSKSLLHQSPTSADWQGPMEQQQDWLRYGTIVVPLHHFVNTGWHWTPLYHHFVNTGWHWTPLWGCCSLVPSCPIQSQHPHHIQGTGESWSEWWTTCSTGAGIQ